MPSEESQLSKRHHLEDPTRKTSNQKLQTPRSDAEVLSLFGYSKEKSTITCSLDNSEVIHNNNLVGFSPHDLALCFPDKNLIARGPPLPSPLALHFESFFQYQQTYCNILRDYLNFVTYKTARIYHEILSSVDFSPSLGVDLINSAIKSEKIPFCEHGKVELALLGNSPFSNGEPVHAIRVCHASTEVQCYENLSRHMGDSTTCPIYDFLLGRQTQSGTPTRTLHISVSQKFELVESFITKYALNNDQSLALKRLADMV
ncbi:uncharacterized protein LOC135121294 [Zophobas morio]|uniref:uncharacterized protein LOC135121294 n=1 Tax=Zophobas morio TaxID=2755281 RepID=UPI0030836D34